MKKIIRHIKDYIYYEGFWSALFALIFAILMWPFLLFIAIMCFIDKWVRELCKPEDDEL